MDKIINIEITEVLDGKNIKDILYNHINLSASVIRSIKRIPDGITLNGTHARVTREVNKNDILTVRIKDDNSPNIEPVDMELDILYEDDEIIAVNKPRGVPTHPSLKHHNDTLANGIMGYYKNSTFTFRAITRLDKDTSGIVLVAKNSHSAKILGEQMRNKEIKKEYFAIINGCPEKEKGIINKPIKRASEGIILRCVAPDGKEAITEYNVLKKGNKYSFVHLIPVTGRTHQLRVHLSYIKTPIYGDDLYGAPQKNEKTLLHCGKLFFRHPETGKEINLVAEIPEDINHILKNEI